MFHPCSLTLDAKVAKGISSIHDLHEYMILINCLADTRFRQIKANYHRWIMHVFSRLLFKMLYLYCSELHNIKLH